MNFNLIKRYSPGFVRARLERLEKSPLNARLARGVYWSLVGSVVSRGAALVLGIVTARVLGKEGFGEYGTIQSTLFMFATYATFSMGLTATKHVAQYRKSDPVRAGRIIALSNLVALVTGSIAAVIMVLMAPLIAEKMLAAPHLTNMVRLSSVGLLLVVFNSAQTGVISGFEAFKRRSNIQVIAGIGAFPLGVAGVWFFGLTGAVAGLVLASVLLTYLNFRCIRREARQANVPLVWTGLRGELDVLWRFSLPAVLAGAVYVPSMWVANVILVNSEGGYAQMGIFSAADRWRTAIQFLPGLLGGVSLPILSGLASAEQAGAFRKMLWRNVQINLGLALAAAIPIMLASPWIMASYGPEFRVGSWTLVILTLTAVIHSAYWTVGQSFISKGRVWITFSLNLSWAVVLLTTVYFTLRHGSNALALGYLAAESLRMIVGLVICRRAFSSPSIARRSDTETLAAAESN